jgi:hypothetical protein
MIKLPVSIIYAMIAFNITAFTLLLQFDMLIFNSIIIKAISWIVTLGAWSLVYIKRNKFVTLF